MRVGSDHLHLNDPWPDGWSFMKGCLREMQVQVLNVLLLIAGIGGMLFTAGFDFFKKGVSHFGLFQFAGFVISAIVSIAGLRTIGVLRSKARDCLLLLVYLAGTLVMGLRPMHGGLAASRGMLQDLGFSFRDVAINIIGFVPLGYLMMSWMPPADRFHRKSSALFLCLAACTGLSLLIESLQFYIPGRSSSALDVFFNGLGAFGGSLYWLFEKKLSRRGGRGLGPRKIPDS